MTAREGLPVKGTHAEAWEALRPKIVHDTKPVKVRGVLGISRGRECLQCWRVV